MTGERESSNLSVYADRMSHSSVPGSPQEPAYSYDPSRQAEAAQPLPGPTEDHSLQPMSPQARSVSPQARSVPPQAWPVQLSARDLRPEHFPTTVGKDGRIAWSLGLLGLIGFPGLAIIAASLAMLIAGLLQLGKNPVATVVGRRAAIFGGISLLATVLFFVMIFVIAPALIDAGIIEDSSPGSALFMVPLAVWVVLAGPLTCLVMGIVGLAKPISREKAERIFARAGR